MVLLHRRGRVENLSDMRFPHNNPGITTWKGYIHVFGSHAGLGEVKCERLSLYPMDCNWELLSDVHKRRAQFTPVVWTVQFTSAASMRIEQ